MGSVKTNRARSQDRGTSQEPEGRRPQKRWAPSPEPDGLQPRDWFSGALRDTFLNTSWLLAQSEVDNKRAGDRSLGWGEEEGREGREGYF